MFCTHYPYFCFTFSIFIRFRMLRIWVDTNSVLNYSFFISKPRLSSWLYNYPLIYSSLKFSLILFLNDRLWYRFVCTREKQGIFRTDSINSLFIKFKVRKIKLCCKKTIFSIIIISVPGLPKNILLKLTASKMIRKDFQSIRGSISSSLSRTG